VIFFLSAIVFLDNPWDGTGIRNTINGRVERRRAKVNRILPENQGFFANSLKNAAFLAANESFRSHCPSFQQLHVRRRLLGIREKMLPAAAIVG
jgi:hypothetical protein